MFQRQGPNTKMSPSSMEVSEARFKRFLKELETYERKLEFERTLDALLDLYSSWRRSHEQPLKLRIVMLVFELHRLDSHFECTLSFRDQPETSQPCKVR